MSFPTPSACTLGIITQISTKHHASLPSRPWSTQLSQTGCTNITQIANLKTRHIYKTPAYQRDFLQPLKETLSTKRTMVVAMEVTGITYFFVCFQQTLAPNRRCDESLPQGAHHRIRHFSAHALRIAVKHTGVTLIILNDKMQGSPLWVHSASMLQTK